MNMFFRLLIVLLFIAGSIHFLFIGMEASADTLFFHAFAEYIRTGQYAWPFPNMPYTQVRTGAAPLFSLLLTAIYEIPRSDILLHAIHLGFFGGTLFLLYRMLRAYIRPVVAMLAVTMFAFIPGNLIFISWALSDLGAQFLFTLYCFLLWKYRQTCQVSYLSFSVFAGFLTGLWRYSFVVFGAVSLVWFFCAIILKKPHRVFIVSVPALLGIFLISVWIVIQHALTGVWGIADDVDIRYSNQMLLQAKRVPPEDDPAMIRVRQFVPKTVDMRQPYWELEPYFWPQLGYDYVRINTIIGEVGKAAMYRYPLDFLRVSANAFFATHWNIMDVRHFLDEHQRYCGQVGTVAFCKPILTLWPFSQSWNGLVRISQPFYHWIFPLWSVGLFFPSLVWVLFVSHASFSRQFGLLFLIGRLPIALSTWPDQRYLVPFYPLMIIITCLAMRDWYRILRRRTVQKLTV